MGIRMACVVAAVFVGPGWLRWLAIAGAVFLPYIAVVMANAEESRGDDFELDGVGAGHELEAPPTVREVGRQPAADDQSEP
jgi:hypothetical protein